MTEMKRVRVTLHTTVRNGQDEETYELTTFGTFQEKGDSLYLRYKEVQEDLQEIQSTVKWSKDEVFIMRNGQVKMRQKFIKDMMTVGNFESPYGTLQMLTTAKDLKHEYKERYAEGTMTLIYDLTMQGADAGQYKMVIEYKEETQ
ncbi:DUF1934 domain-containing protein [Bacillus testis]|uniref:DUF1934 domain-containing protein n=1 Tax=Bacillus testis TaxID=1622072 RepID=UPI000A72DAA7|nr:DUF1934 domain-containing protein [Bacillus testis]